MEAQIEQRRLTTILAADVVGYSRLMGVDEAGTLVALKAHRRELIKPKTAHYNGRTVKLMGDGALMEFASVVDAVRFAVEVQEAMAERNAPVPEDRRIRFRIGINIGDIIVDGDDIYGDGVNVAARLEGLAEPGGICVARNVFNQVKNKLDIGFVHLGEKRVKNITEPVEVYRVAVEGAATAGLSHPRLWRRIALAAATMAVLVIVGVAAWKYFPATSPSTDAIAIDQTALPALPGGPSIAVLPFDDFSGEVHGYFAIGLHEDLITELARNRNLFVIARNSVSQYVQGLAGAAIDVSEAGDALGARYLVEGSVDRSADRIRVSAQLIEAETERHIWAKRFDRAATVADIFAMRDELAQDIASAILPHIKIDEEQHALAKPPRSLTAYELTVQGRYHKHQLTPESMVIAKRVLREAIEIDPEYAEAYAYLGYAIYVDYVVQLTADAQSPGAFEEAKHHLQTAIRLRPDLAVSYQALAQILANEGQTNEALTHAFRAVEFGPSDAENWIFLARNLLSAGRIDDAVEAGDRAMRQNPFAPVYYLNIHGRNQYFAGNFDAARNLLSLCLIQFPGFLSCRAYLAATLVELDEMDAASREIDDLLNRLPNASVDWLATTSAIFDPDMKSRLADDLQMAGLPLITP